MARRVWRCLGCRISLGVIVGDAKLPDGRHINGELAIDAQTATIVTEPRTPDAYHNVAGTMVRCRYCGKSKRWYGALRNVTVTATSTE